MKNWILKYLIISFLFSVFVTNAQKNSFVVTKINDTIYVDKIKVKYEKIIVAKDKKKKKYLFDEILCYYNSKENKHYEKVLSPFVKKIEKTKDDKYDYRKREMSFIKTIDNSNKYIFFNRLTNGKVKLFSYTNKNQSDLMTPSNPFPTSGYSNTSYFIAIYDSKLEPLNKYSMKLNKTVYEILRIYLYGNNKIKKRLDDLYLSKPKAKEDELIELINDYNKWIESNN